MSDRPMCYKLVGHEAVPCGVEEGARLFEDPSTRRVAETFVGNVRVSTVFLAFDHSLTMQSKPVLFETMVFGGPLDQSQERYETWEQAEAGHARWVDRVLSSERGIEL